MVLSNYDNNLTGPEISVIIFTVKRDCNYIEVKTKISRYRYGSSYLYSCA